MSSPLLRKMLLFLLCSTTFLVLSRIRAVIFCTASHPFYLIQPYEPPSWRGDSAHPSQLEARGNPDDRVLEFGRNAHIDRRWIEEYNHDRRYRGVGNRAPREAFLVIATVLKNVALTV